MAKIQIGGRKSDPWMKPCDRNKHPANEEKISAKVAFTKVFFVYVYSHMTTIISKILWGVKLRFETQMISTRYMLTKSENAISDIKESSLV